MYRNILSKSKIFSALFASTILVLTTTGNIFAQQALFYNNGAMVYVNTGGILYVDSIMENGDSTLINKGHILVTQDFRNQDYCGYDDNVNVSQGNDGVFEVRGDWENNGVFESGNGKVLLNGTIDQLIRGTEITAFDTLEIDSGGIVYQFDIDAIVKGELRLNNRELNTQDKLLTVTNTNPSAVTRVDSGFVSSLESGALVRHTNTNSSYLFPVGSSLFQSYKYRPAQIEADITNPVDTNIFAVRMVNANPSPLPPNGPGYDVTSHDDSICFVNPEYWYRIRQTQGNADASLTLTYMEASEGEFNGIARWDSLGTPIQWNSLNSQFGTNNYQTNPDDLKLVKRTLWDDFDLANSGAYTLTFRNPYAPVINGLNELCANAESEYSINPQNNSTIVWQLETGAGTITDSVNGTISVIWNDVDTTTMTVTETVGNFNSFSGTCESYPTLFGVDVWPLPIADFEALLQYNNGLSLNGDSVLFINELVTFSDSSSNTATWDWDFGDGSTSTYENPFHTYGDTGSYTVSLITTSPDGCLDTAYTTLYVDEGLIIPNVFTPDGDNYNDVFTIRNSKVGEFELQIYNRWGNLIYETKAPEVSWDGRTSAGIEAVPGTYFWTLNATLQSGNTIADYETKETGTLTLIR